MHSVLDFAGVIRAQSVFQMMDMANALGQIPHIHPSCRTAILTLSGGAGILACDALEKSGAVIAELSEETRQAAAEVFPPWMPVFNPVDLFPAVALKGRKAAFSGAFGAVVADPNTDVLVIHFVAGLEGASPDLFALKQQAEENGKVLVFWLMGRQEGSRQFREDARNAGLLVYEDVTRLAECLSAAARFSAHRRAEQDRPSAPETENSGSAVCPDSPAAEGTWDEYDSKQLLTGYDIPAAAETLVKTADAAWAWAQ